jgi:site-specific DNA recombinase
VSRLPRLAVYARTSTDHQQWPEDSLAWQLSLARSLAADRAEIIDPVHETDPSPSAPWARRHKASQLLLNPYSPDRAWDGIIGGEPQQAFGPAAQEQDILPTWLTAARALWVPEVGGPVDLHSEAHDLLFDLFGWPVQNGAP